jgi:hypothetical protein
MANETTVMTVSRPNDEEARAIKTVTDPSLPDDVRVFCAAWALAAEAARAYEAAHAVLAQLDQDLRHAALVAAAKRVRVEHPQLFDKYGDIKPGNKNRVESFLHGYCAWPVEGRCGIGLYGQTTGNDPFQVALKTAYGEPHAQHGHYHSLSRGVDIDVLFGVTVREDTEVTE